MTSRDGRGADLSFTVARSSYGFSLNIKKGLDKRPFFGLELSDKAMQAGARLYDNLRAFKDRAPNLDVDPSPEVAAPALDALRYRGTIVSQDLCGGDLPFQALKSAVAAELPLLGRLGREPPLVDIFLPIGASLPFELLPLFDRNWPCHPLKTRQDVLIAAASFPGFACIVRRVPPASLPQETQFGPMPLNIAAVTLHDDLDGAEKEIQRLRGFAEFDVEEVFPREVGPTVRRGILRRRRPSRPVPLAPEAATRILSHRIFHACGPTPGRGRDQVLHFACHCDLVGPTADEGRIRIGEGSEVSMGDIRVALSYRRNAGGTSTPAPLVFMNACGTSSIDPSSASSFVAVLLENGNVAFIGTETLIPDSFAAEFASAFYGLVAGGASVGDAAYQARWELLNRYMNPLGVLYTLHGNPDLRVTHGALAAVS